MIYEKISLIMNWKLYVVGKSGYQLKSLVNTIEWYGVFSGITHVRLSVICTHLHSSVWRSQVQFVGLHSWGGSFLSQNIWASVTTLEFSSIGQRTIVTDQELQNHTHLPQNGNNKALKNIYSRMINSLIWRPGWRDLPKHHKCTINTVFFVIITGCHTYIIYSFESFNFWLPISPLLHQKK